jgi:cobalamin biosynthetic protein CobC
MRDHGGNLDAAIARFGGVREEWIDLSTGINPRPYPLPPMPQSAWSALPTTTEIDALADAATVVYGSAVRALPIAGAQAAIQIVPRLAAPGIARVLAPTYNEHAAALQNAGWDVRPERALDRLAGADLAVVVNPNNPDGRQHRPTELLSLANHVKLLVVDESFADADPSLSLAGEIADNVIVLRSFGKFYGLAGLRLGFALAAPALRTSLQDIAGPWAVSGPAVAVGCVALSDTAWRKDTVVRLERDAARLDKVAEAAGCQLVGGTSLFRLYETGNAAATQERMAEARIWTRRFPYEAGWLRLGLPSGDENWKRVENALP